MSVARNERGECITTAFMICPALGEWENLGMAKKEVCIARYNCFCFTERHPNRETERDGEGRGRFVLLYE